MAKYIECEAALALVRPDDPNDERCAVTVATAKRLIRHALTAAPAADVAPVMHGRWVEGKCSNCGVDIPTDDAYDAIFGNECRFCYYCGAKMDEGDNDALD